MTIAIQNFDDDREETASFNKWLSKPLVRKLISEVHEGDFDFLEALLKDCFDAGVGAGIVKVIERTLPKEPRS